MTNGDVERTRLANERTYLAWWRTGIASLAAGFAIGRIVPEVVDGTSWPYVTLGVLLTVAGLVAIGYGLHRYRALDTALREGRDAHVGDTALLLLGAVGIAVGAFSVALVLFAP